MKFYLYSRMVMCVVDFIKVIELINIENMLMTK